MLNFLMAAFHIHMLVYMIRDVWRYRPSYWFSDQYNQLLVAHLHQKKKAMTKTLSDPDRDICFPINTTNLNTITSWSPGESS